jgi:hypothetical protein
MKTGHLVLGMFLVVGSASLVRAQPELAVRAAVSDLLEKRNYSWTESQATFAAPSERNRRNRPTGAGETIIGSYTTTTLRGRPAVLFGSETVVKLSGGWTLRRLLTEADVEELRRSSLMEQSDAPRNALDNSVEQPPPRARWSKAVVERDKDYAQALPHEVLGYLLQTATNFRDTGAMVAADVAVTHEAIQRLESYLLTGKFPSVVSVRGVLAGVSRASAPLSQPLPEEARAILYVTLAAGAIEEFSVEYTRGGTGLPSRLPTERRSVTTVFILKLSKIGTTNVDVAPEVKALFRDVASTR